MSTAAHEAIIRHRFAAARRGDVAEIWDRADGPGLLRQLGILPAPGPAGR